MWQYVASSVGDSRQNTVKSGTIQMNYYEQDKQNVNLFPHGYCSLRTTLEKQI